MKIALIHDYLCSIGGSERVFQAMIEAFPEAEIYTVALRKNKTFPFFQTKKIRTTWLNPFIGSTRWFRWLFPFITYVVEQIDLEAYDLIISSSATVAKYVKKKKGRHICYCYIPTRAIWHYEEYFSPSLAKKIFGAFLPYFKKRDLAAAARVDTFITLSKTSQKYIEEYYGRKSHLIPSPIDVSKFTCVTKKESHFLVVSRLESWKRVDLAIRVFSKLAIPLRVCGGGGEESFLKKIAAPCIQFLGEVSDEALAIEYGKARGVVFPSLMEYSLVPLEANASGTAVIAYRGGGITEIMIGADTSSSKEATALLFDDLSEQGLERAVMEFEKISFDPVVLRRHAEKWDCKMFQNMMRRVVFQETVH